MAEEAPRPSTPTDPTQNGVKIEIEESPSKRMKIHHDSESGAPGFADETSGPDRRKGVAPIKEEFLIDVSQTAKPIAHADDDAAEAAGKTDRT